MNSISELEQELLALVSTASGLQPAQFSIAKFRESAARTVSDIREDQRAHGVDENSPFFDLIMFDANPLEPAVFLVPMFLADCVKIFIGTGLPNEVISMVNQFAMADVEGMSEALENSGVVHVLEIPSRLAGHWLASA